ncbi:hypothetical protein [Nostoc sp.]|uniref:hypothetical protein n=1 Tax=Nostoc sp. TaxID=1180 RepID=UPI002FFBCE1B
MFIFSHSHHSIKSDRLTNTKTAIALQVQEKRKQRSHPLLLLTTVIVVSFF